MDLVRQNTVSAKNQLKESNVVKFYNPENEGKRIMFAGNSMTLHGIKKDIGWELECGMAASKPENDYVHILMDKINKTNPDTAYCVCQVAEWEMTYKEGEKKHNLYENAKKFDADIIVMRFIENCNPDGFDKDIFKTELSKLLKYLSNDFKAKIIMTTGFWRHPGDEIIREYAKEKNLPLIEMGDLGEDKDMLALDLFWHEGVRIHPGDLGMLKKAERMYEEIKVLL